MSEAATDTGATKISGYDAGEAVAAFADGNGTATVFGGAAGEGPAETGCFRGSTPAESRPRVGDSLAQWKALGGAD